MSLCAALAARTDLGAGLSRRPIRIVVPFSPGGAVDGPTRVVAQELSKRLGAAGGGRQPARCGCHDRLRGGGQAPADGYTLLLASQTNAISATLYPKLSYQPIDDFAPISLIGREPGVVVVHPSLPARNVQELIELARSQPGQIDYASSGNGSGQHLFAAQLVSMAGVKLTHVPYRGSGQATTDLIGGVVKVSVPGTGGHAAAHQERQAERAGGHRRAAFAATARRADARRIGVPRPFGLRVAAGCWRRRARRRRSSTC